MAVSKEIVKACMADLRNSIMEADIVKRDVDFESNGCYVFVGVRHAGKSYLLYQRALELLHDGHSWDELICIDFDDERLVEFTASDFNTLLEIHYEQSEKKPILFLDEAQRIDGWELFARRMANQKITTYITGSNAKALSAEIATALGGRYFIQDVYPYSFSEFLRSKNVELAKDWEYSTKKRGRVVSLYNEYTQYGGLPEMSDFTHKRARLNSLFQKIYLGDICARHKVQNAHALNIMIKKLAESVKQPVSFNRICNIVASTGCKSSLPTIIDYMDYAVESWLILPVQNYVAKLAEKESNRKYYFVDSGLLNLFLLNQDTALLENQVAIHLCRIYGKENVCFANDGNNEIDFVVEDHKLAIQAAYSLDDEQSKERELKPLSRFLKAHPDWQCLIITNDTEGDYSYNGTTIHVLPAWKWFLGLRNFFTT